MFSNAQMIARLRKAGACYAPIIMANDVAEVMVVKSDLISLLADLPADEQCEWAVVKDHGDSFYIDVAS